MLFESNLANQVKTELQNSMVLFHDDNSKYEIFDHYCTTWWKQFTILLIRRGFKEKKHEQLSCLSKQFTT